MAVGAVRPRGEMRRRAVVAASGTIRAAATTLRPTIAGGILLAVGTVLGIVASGLEAVPLLGLGSGSVQDWTLRAKGTILSPNVAGCAGPLRRLVFMLAPDHGSRGRCNAWWEGREGTGV